MRANPLPLIGGFYADETRPWSQQDICNYLPVAAESDGTRTPTMAKTPPGLSPFARISGEPSRGVYSAEDRLFTVLGNTLYQVTPTAASSLGSISGTGRVRFAHNQITNGNQVLIVNGSAGWVWDTVTSTLTLISDTGYPGAINARFIDGYLIQIEPARRFAFHSDLADALSYNTLDRFTSEVSPDLLVSMAVSNNELILFSERTTEFFENTGATQQPFRSKRISFNKGCAGRYTVAEMDNTVYWLGDDGSFYRLDGYTPIRISTRPIEQAIRGLNWDDAFAFVWEDSGHAVCYWTFPGGFTFGYDASQQKWHRRSSYGFDRWRVQDMTYWQRRWIASDFQKGRLWELDWAYPWEFDQEFISELTSPVVHDNQSRVLMPRLEVVMDTGQPEVAIRDFVVDVGPLTITGDVPDGDISAVISGTYTISGGVPPYGPVTILSGTFPPGLTLNPNGSYSGTYTTVGNYSWVVQVVDADGNGDTHADSAAVESLGWMATYNGGSIKMSPDGDDWSAAGFKPSDGSGVIWSPILGGHLVRGPNGDILASCTAVEVVPTAVNVALRSVSGVWSRSTFDAPINSDGGETIHTGTHYFMSGGASSGTSKISSNGANFTNIPSLRCEAAALGNAFVIGTGGYFGSLDTTKIALDGSSFTAGTSIATGNTLAQRGAASDTSSPRRACFAGVLGGGSGTGVIGIYSTINDASTWSSHTNPFPAGHGLTVTSNIRVHYGLGRWFVFAGTRVAHGLTLDTLVLDSHVFPQQVNNADSDGIKLIACGNSGMLQKWTLAGGWVSLTSGMSTVVFDVVASPELS